MEPRCSGLTWNRDFSKKVRSMFLGPKKGVDYFKLYNEVDSELQSVRRTISSEVKNLSSHHIPGLQNKVQNLEQNTPSLVKALMDDHINAVQALENMSYQNKSLTANLATAAAEMKSKEYAFNTEIDKLNMTYTMQITEKQHETDKMTMGLETEIGKMREKHRKEIKEQELHQQSNEMAHQNELMQLRQVSEREKQKIISVSQEEKRRMKADIERLTHALAEQDNFRPAAHTKLRQKFQTLSEDIENLARLQWKLLQGDWTMEVLEKLSENPRRLQKEILQDSLWMVLFETVFCSPFRMLGNEGARLEVQWNERYLEGILFPRKQLEYTRLIQRRRPD
jgi:hypothetical protein